MQKFHLYRILIMLGMIFPLLVGCNRFTTSRTHDYSKSIDIKSLGSKAIATVLDAEGKETAAFSAASAFTQEISASAASALSGTVLSFPPGSLVIDTAISLEEGSTLATASSAAALGIGSSVSRAGAAVVVNSSAAVDPAQPFVLKINLGGSSLALADSNENLVVIYKIQIFAENRFVLGVLPRSALTIDGQQVSFSTPHFGVFQTAYAQQPVTEATRVTVNDGVQTKREVAALPAFSITGRSLFVVGADKEVVLSGNHFRPTIKLAMGGKTVGNIRVLSDTALAFTTPTGGTLGLTQLTADQDGVSQAISLIYSGAESDIPVSTLGPADMCEGTRYYNGKGQLTTGSKVCSATLPACTEDGQTGCMTTSVFKSIDTRNLNAEKILIGNSLGGISGTAVAETHSNCATDGQAGCVVVAPSFAALLKTGAQDKILSSHTLGGVTGNVTLPAASKVLLGVSYGTAGTSSVGALTLPAAGLVKSGSAPYGEAGSQLTPSYSPDFPDPVNVRMTDTVNGTNGTLGDCSAAGQSSCVATSVYKTMNLTGSGSGTGLTSANFNGTIISAGNFEFWDAAGARHQVMGTSNLYPGNIRAGVSLFGVNGSYPSTVYPLASSTAAADLTMFMTQLTTDGSFEYFDSTGTRYTGSGDSDLVPANVKNGVQLENLSIVGSYFATLVCPAGWIKVPGDSAYGTGDFCVMKYEAKSDSGIARSVAGIAPWVNISQTAAIGQCRGLGPGYDLISNAQWMTIGANVAGIAANWTSGNIGTGSLYSGHNDNSPASACQASNDETLFYVEGTCMPASTSSAPEQKRTLMLSNGAVIWDFSGNVGEWVNFMNRSDKPMATNIWYEYMSLTVTPSTALKDLVPTFAVKSFWSDSWSSSGQRIGKFYPGINGSGGALMRGGAWSDSTIAGVFAANLSIEPTVSSYPNIGFRCVLTAPPPP